MYSKVDSPVAPTWFFHVGAFFFDASTDPPPLRSADFQPWRHRAPLIWF